MTFSETISSEHILIVLCFNYDFDEPFYCGRLAGWKI